MTSSTSRIAPDEPDLVLTLQEIAQMIYDGHTPGENRLAQIAAACSKAAESLAATPVQPATPQDDWTQDEKDRFTAALGEAFNWPDKPPVQPARECDEEPRCEWPAGPCARIPEPPHE